MATSTHLTPQFEGFGRETLQNAINSGLGIIVICPDESLVMCLYVWPHVNSELSLYFPQMPFPWWPAVTSAIRVNASTLCEYVLFWALFFFGVYMYVVIHIVDRKGWWFLNTFFSDKRGYEASSLKGDIKNSLDSTSAGAGCDVRAKFEGHFWVDQIRYCWESWDGILFFQVSFQFLTIIMKANFNINQLMVPPSCGLTLTALLSFFVGKYRDKVRTCGQAGR